MNSSSRFQIHNSMEKEKVKRFYSNLCSSFPSRVSKSHPPEVGAEEWENAERTICEVLSVIQPTFISEHRRKEIIQQIQVMFGSFCGVKVYPFGSVPLQTYLPDGDIDLSVVSPHDTELLSGILCSLLQYEVITNRQIQVTDVQFVHAQVKVIKCQVNGMSVDICFNQVAGLCALSFLEQVDRLIGKGHLFKRSVVLIKTWCFYESRLLGATFGLISTYALETMVAHIFNLFHSSLDSPLAVLYKFLGYYSEFDWEKYCVAIEGLVQISSLPEVVVTKPDGCDPILLSPEFLRRCRESYSYVTGMIQAEQRGLQEDQNAQGTFQLKFLNVIDPLKDSNNIGRSVSKASFYRARHAFKYGFSNLKEILASPVEEVGYRTGKFFKTVMVRMGVGNSRTHDSENLLAGIDYGLNFHEFGIHQGCNNPASPDNIEQNAMSEAHESFDSESSSSGGVTMVPVLGESANSRGTGTFIPQMAYNQRRPFNQSRGRTSRYAPNNGNFNSTRMMEEEIPDTGSVRLGDEVEFPPLQGRPSRNGNRQR